MQNIVLPHKVQAVELRRKQRYTLLLLLFPPGRKSFYLLLLFLKYSDRFCPKIMKMWFYPKWLTLTLVSFIQNGLNHKRGLRFPWKITILTLDIRTWTRLNHHCRSLCMELVNASTSDLTNFIYGYSWPVLTSQWWLDQLSRRREVVFPPLGRLTGYAMTRVIQ